MSLFSNVSAKTNNVKLGDPRKVFNNILKEMSGTNATRNLKFNMLYTVYAFKGVAAGVGTSTIVANTAVVLAELGLSVCVVDTSVLTPVQDILLKTGRKDEDLDWFDMPYNKTGFLKQSGYSNKISVLSFSGKRTVLDAVGTKDTSALVSLMMTTLHSKFDIILIDCCEELTEINTACLQQAHRVIQVWNDAPQIAQNIYNFIQNCSILTCPLDKMRYVVYSKMDNISGGGKLDDLAEQYKVRNIATNSLSLEVASAINQGTLPYEYVSRDKGVEEYSNCIINIVSVICNLGEYSNDKVVTSEELSKPDKKEEKEEKE